MSIFYFCVKYFIKIFVELFGCTYLYEYIRLYMNMDIYDYIVRELLRSNTFYYVNGTPQKRLMRIKEYAWHQYNNMSDDQFEIINKKIEINKRKNNNN